MNDDNRNGATGAPIEENPNDIAIALDLAGGADAWIEMTEAERAAAVREVAEIRQALEDPDAQDAEEIIKESVRKNRAFLSDDDLSERVADIFSSFSAKGARYTFNSVLRWAENLGGIAPYYERLVNEKPEYAELKNAHASVTLRPKEDDPEDVKALHELFRTAWAEAAQIWKEHEAEGQADLENVQGRRLKEWINPTDKNSALFFGPAIARMANDVPGQMTFIPELMNETNAIPINNGRRAVTKSGKKQNALLFLTYDDDNATMRQLNVKWGDDYAKNFFVTFAATNLFIAGNRKVTLSQLFRAMPGKTNGTPSKAQLQDLFRSVLQCISTTVYINTKDISERWGIDKYKEIIAPVLPAKWVNERVTINGALADAYLELYDVSPFFQLARDMQQIQPINLKALEIKLSRTETNYRVLYYLLRQVLWMQNPKGKRSNLITYEDLRAGVGGGREDRLKKTCFSILEQWRNIGFISGYKETENGRAPGIEIDSRKLLTD